MRNYEYNSKETSDHWHSVMDEYARAMTPSLKPAISEKTIVAQSVRKTPSTGTLITAKKISDNFRSLPIANMLRNQEDTQDTVFDLNEYTSDSGDDSTVEEEGIDKRRVPNTEIIIERFEIEDSEEEEEEEEIQFTINDWEAERERRMDREAIRFNKLASKKYGSSSSSSSNGKGRASTVQSKKK